MKKKISIQTEVIQDDGVRIEKKISSIIIIGVTSGMSLLLIFLGVMALIFA